MNRFAALLLLACSAPRLHAAGCAATPEAAVHNAVGTGQQAGANTGTGGYRVQDVHVDAVMRRVWVRVARCDDPSQPPVLVPLNIARAQNAPVPSLAPQQQATATSTAAPAPMQTVAIHAGDAVKVVFASATVQMELEGTADTQAALGDMMNVTLKRRGDEPPHRIHGVLRADHRVEVQQ